MSIYYYGTTLSEFQKILKRREVKLNKDEIALFKTEKDALMYAYASVHKSATYVVLEFELLEPQYVEKLENTETYTYPFPLSLDELRSARFYSLEDIAYV